MINTNARFNHKILSSLLVALAFSACVNKSSVTKVNAMSEASLQPKLVGGVVQVKAVKNVWNNLALPIPANAKAFTAHFTVKLSSSRGDTVIGLSESGVTGTLATANPTTASNYQKLATVVHLSSKSIVDALNDSTYSTVNAFSYKANTSYVVAMNIDLTNHLYQVQVRKSGISTFTIIAKDFKFRTEQALVHSLNSMSILSTGGSVSITALTIDTPVVALPIVSTRIAAPTGLTPSNGASVNAATSVRISWNPVMGASGYLIRAERLVVGGAAIEAIPQNNSYQQTTFDLPVIAGNNYRFWVHAYDQNFNTGSGYIPANYSEPTAAVFAVLSAPVSTLACGTIANGATITRTMYQSASVASGLTCVSETQTATCSNGVMSAYSGTFGNSQCFIQSATPTGPSTGACANGSATSITQFGITWTFAERPCGQYANGDYWVLGPVTISHIDPLPTDGQNGTMINPQVGISQGFDKDFNQSYNPYVSELNVGKTLPLIVPVDSSVVSSITVDPWVAGYGRVVLMHAILTVVKSKPAPGSFRPSSVGTGSRESLWNESQLDYSKLRKLPRAQLSSIPSISDYFTNHFKYPWFEINPHWTGVYLRPQYMAGNGYGRVIADRTGDAALLLNLDFSNAEKRDLLVSLIQVGIDNYGFLLNGGVWYADGGQNIGRLSPVMVAAAVLNDQRLKDMIDARQNQRFQELQNTFFVSSVDVNPSTATPPYARGSWSTCNGVSLLAGTNCDLIIPYTVNDIGMPEWGIRHSGEPNMDNNNKDANYRDINGGSFTSVTMAARCLSMRSAIGHEALFLYAERHLSYEDTIVYNYNPTPQFHKEFYYSFKANCP